ncbi:hypothetical protein QBC34DRAFT_380881 [Podospora aff. communis PSN243]|uniref:Ecp2 effector protein domain-containing protein n=1 Tax=Podospora aff. communis PSN243 TaxID=3040156 RepID=A0AAV9GK80_9PEZI|nr:hypothetical protein QBC34DRAFT_380881 [Podospora aff. communis PSN243]
MKLSVLVVSLAATLATAMPAALSDPSNNATELVPRQNEIFYEWVCNKFNGGGGQEALRRSKAYFDHRFGTNVLTAASKQCYGVGNDCHGYYLLVCNHSGITRSELPGMRDEIANRAVNDDWGCVTTTIRDSGYMRYYWGKSGTLNSLWDMPNKDWRNC